MTLKEKYEKYFIDIGQSEKSKYYYMSSEGWKILIKENITPLIEDILKMKQIDDYVWASDFENGKRKVLSFFFVNDAFATFKWGWNFEFVPKIVGNKAVWARTDKTIYTHIYELSPDFYNVKNTDEDSSKAYDSTIMSRFYIENYDVEKGLEKKIKAHKDVFFRLLPLMQEYYDSTDSYEKILQKIDENMENGYYCFIGSAGSIAKVFIKKKLGFEEKAYIDFEKLSFANENIKNEYYKKLCKI